MVGLMAVAALAVSSQVTDVTVYRDRAQVVRTAEVQLEQGINTLRFEDLPDATDSRGIQVDGSGAATVLDVRFKTENFTEIPREEWQHLYNERDRLQNEIKEVELRIQRLKELKGFLERISEKVTHRAETEGRTDLNPGSWSRMLTLYVDKGAEYDEGLQAANNEIKELRKGLEKVQADIRDAGADSRKQRRIIEVDLESARPGKAEIQVSYLVAGPGWHPTYDVRVDTRSRQMELQYYALVRQNTGEDWGGVSLKLSTARPGLGGKHPDLMPWRIDLRPEVAAYGLDKSSLSSMPMPSPKPQSSMMMYNTFDFAGAEKADVQKPMEVRQAAVKTDSVAAVFEVKGASVIEADNVEHRVAVSRVSLPARFRYSVVPKMDRHAYLKAKAVNESESPLLEGKANIFLDGSYVATSSLDLVAPGEEFWIFLGADEGMQVEYKLVQKYTSYEGLIGKTTRYRRDYLITVKNTHSEPEEVIVWDQIPISGNEDIEVDLIEPAYSKDTDALKIDEEQRIQWFRTVPPGETWEIPLQYRVETPRGMKVKGFE